jgi:UDP-4-amino-4,6-dideoxy-N-acetyl-beta-L-altrosamine transaminase
MTEFNYLPYGRQDIDEDDILSVIDCLKGDLITTGPITKKFEEAFADYVGAKYAVSCNSGTAALHLSLLSLGLKEGDKVIVPSLTFLSTANSVRYCGAEVVFADCDSFSGLIKEDDIIRIIKEEGEKVKGIIPVHLNGLCCNMGAISNIANRYKLFVVEDACHAIGGMYPAEKVNDKDFNVGSCIKSNATIFSMHPVKTITMGEGGIVTTNSKSIYEKICEYKNHGMTKNPDKFINKNRAFNKDGKPFPWYYEMQALGFNYRASDIQCALGLSQLKKLKLFVNKRIELAHYYNKLLLDLSDIVKPIANIDFDNYGLHLYVVHINFSKAKINRFKLMRKLNDSSIGTQVHYQPVHLQPYYENRYGSLSLSGAENYYNSCLSLPLFPKMSFADVERVVKTIHKILRK